ncbi:M20/M25/M40 family metallo-hydrolase [Clostridium cibarium]|uniref:M20/M25/M40 family metallo-hydrolase n=1 Tax=Clostridium cibarium TaxID=2762247 RepID=A0ABR8PQN9_9CLOT|nr:M20/M25/M40 family metallo-hydrolase [Clostridium cibarium]MBD7910485.1 M20/M25/M40 family metallo-hydrolase [Clostridium cibarium]
MYEEILDLTKKLVNIPSVNNTVGEKNIACFIEKYLRAIPYFKKYPTRVFLGKLNDSLDRRNVFALIKGEGGISNNTIILHGHMDTVDVDDFGNIRSLAFNCEKLEEKLKELELQDEVESDLESEKWLFGRGACDMKSGVAVFLVIIKKLSELVEKIDGNILLSINPVEENSHTGIIKALDTFNELKEKEKLNYLFAINNDYICPLYPGDKTRYIYTGSVGKLLPCFYIQGKETHVGQCFEGFDASTIASELIRQINLNIDFCDVYEGEYTLPPSVLKIKDLKKQYNVQTAFESFVYFNYFVHNESISNIIRKLKKVSLRTFENVLALINENYKKYCNITGIGYEEINYKVQVMEYDELYEFAKDKYSGNLECMIDNLTDKFLENGEDVREISLKITKKLIEISDIKIPTIVIFFAAPYCPHNTLKKEIEEERELFDEISEIAKEFEIISGEEYKVMRFFPSLTDSSYLKVDDDYESIERLFRNFPEYMKLYNVPIELAKELNIPGINYGCFGKDAHKWTERVYKPYSFDVLPKLIMKTLERYLIRG